MEPSNRPSDAATRWRCLSIVLAIAVVVLLLLLRCRPKPAAPPPPQDPRKVLLERYHAPEETERAIDEGLLWLVEHQAPDGSWGMNARACPSGAQCSDIVLSADYADALTGLAEIALVVRGVPERPAPPDPEREAIDRRFREASSKALDFLLSRQAEDGSWSQGYMYATAIDLLALVEASARTGRKDLGPRIAKAIDFIARSQSHGGGWDYYGCGARKGDPNRNDSSIVAWACIALATADECGFAVPDATVVGIVLHLHGVTNPETQLLGYVERGQNQSWTCRSIGLLSRLFLGYDPIAGPVRRQAKAILADRLPPDLYYWYHGSMGMFQEQDLFPLWSRTVQQALVGLQVHQGHEAGSWKAMANFDGRAGRVEATELAVLSLEVYFRHSVLDERPAERFAAPRAIVRLLPSMEDAKGRAALLEELGLMRADDAVLACLSDRAEKDPDDSARAAAKASLAAIRARADGPSIVEEREFTVSPRCAWTAAPFDTVSGEEIELTVEGSPKVPLFARIGLGQTPVQVASPFHFTSDRYGRLFLGPGDLPSPPPDGEWKVKAIVRFRRPTPAH